MKRNLELIASLVKNKVLAEKLNKLFERLDEFYEEAFSFFCSVGAVIIRKSRNFKRRYNKFGKRVYWTAKRYTMDFYDFVGDFFEKGAENISRPFKESGAAIKAVTEELAGEKLENHNIFPALWKYRREVIASFSSFKTPLKKMFNYLLPVLSVFIFGFTILYINSLSFNLSVSYNGSHIGYIADESVFNDAEKEVRSRLAYEDGQKQNVLAPVFKLSVTDKSSLSNADEVSNEIIKVSGGDISKADGLYIDDDFIGATDNGRSLLTLLDDIKDSYKTDNPNQTVEFANKIEIKEGLYPSSAISGLGSIKSKLGGTVEQAVVYTVKPGDTPSEVAQRHGISTSELIQKNEEVSKTFRPGEKLTIKAAVDRLTVQVSEVITYNEDIPFGTDKSESNQYLQGVKKVTRAGVPGTERITAKVVSINGVEQSRTIIDREVVREPVNQKVVIGTKVPLYSSNNVTQTNQNFIWPVAGGRLSCGFMGYRNHTGMDIGARVGTPVYASAAGTVTYAGWKAGGYGNLVVIDHGGGVSTKYLHNSSINVSPGQYVAQGQQIATVGQTGRAYGSHCHFEVRLSGTPVNPANYIGTRSPY